MPEPRTGGALRADPGGGLALVIGLLLLVLPIACRDAPTQAPAELPNILLLLADDQGVGDLSLYGHPSIRTPRIDALGAQGMTLDHAFTSAPVCIPSRGALMTGRYPQSSGIVGFGARGHPKQDVVTLIEVLHDLGYRSGVIGKSSLFPLRRYPFDFRRYSKNRSPGGYAKWVGEFVEEDDGRPYFLLVSLRDPHRPFPSAHNPRVTIPGEDVTVPAFLADTPAVRTELARYYAAIARLDESVGSILDELDGGEVGAPDLTIYTADHGASFPYAKATLYDAGMRVPFIVRWPDVVTPESRSDALVSLIDLLPTLLEGVGAGREIPAGIQGRSFLRVLRGEATEHREIVFGALDWIVSGRFPSRAARTRERKYIYTPPNDAAFVQESLANPSWRSMRALAVSDEAVAARVENLLRRPREELYDLESDPAELSNLLAGDTNAHAQERADLARQLGCWMQEIGDDVALPSELPPDRPCLPAARDGLGLR